MLTLGGISPGSTAYARPVEPYITTSVSKVGIDRSQEKWIRVFESLSGMRGLTDSWDGQGAAAPSHKLVESAIELAGYLRATNVPPPTSAVATPSGTVLLIWHGMPYLEIEIVVPYRAETMTVGEDGVATHGVFSPSPNER